jgi:hypothetical protein
MTGRGRPTSPWGHHPLTGQDLPWPPTSEERGHDQLTNAAACAWFGAFEEPGRLSRCLPWMSLRADMYRQRAAEAKQSAARAKNPWMKSAFEEAAAGWLVLAGRGKRVARAGVQAAAEGIGVRYGLFVPDAP